MKRKITDPVSCDFYDELEAASTLGKILDIEMRDERAVKHVIRGRVADLYTARGSEWCKMEDGTEFEIRSITSFKPADEPELPGKFIPFPQDNPGHVRSKH